MLEAQGERALEFIEADPRALRWFIALSLLALLAAAALLALAGLPPESADGPEALGAIAHRALGGAAVATLLAVALAAAAWWLAARTVRSGQWPPAGVPMPLRTRVQRVARPGLAWGVAAAVTAALAAVAGLYWLHYLDARALAAIYTLAH